MQRNGSIFDIPDLKTIVVSYPKTGRTWLRFLIGKAVCEARGLDESLIFKPIELSRAAGIPTMVFTHDRAIPVVETGHQAFSEDKSAYAGMRVVFLVRDPRDVVVSHYFHLTRRAPIFAGGVSEFVRDPRFGAESVMRFYSVWHANRGVPEAFLPIRYEAISADPAGALRACLDFIGAGRIDEAVIQRAAEASSFDAMQAMERDGRINHPKLRPADPKDADSYKVRRGKIGGYVDYLSAEDIAYIDGLIERHATPLFPYPPIR